LNAFMGAASQLLSEEKVAAWAARLFLSQSQREAGLI
jgi:hypothetical protein